MDEVSVILLAIAVIFAFAQWRLGLLLCVITAILQDPARKLAPDQPATFVLFVGIVFAAACFGAVLQGVSLTPKSLFRGYPQIMKPIVVLLILIVFEAFNSYLRFDSLMIPLIGLLTYLLPLPSMAFAYQLSLRGGEVRIKQFIWVYVLCSMIALSTIYFEFAGYDWPVLGQVGGSHVVFDKTLGVMIFPKSGIFRASEIAAWHAMTCACFVLLLATWQRINLQTLFFAAIIMILLMGIAVLTGRRKAVVEVVVFAGTYLLLWLIFKKNMVKVAVPMAVAGLLAFGWFVLQIRDGSAIDRHPSRYDLYLRRSETVFEDVPSRFVELGIAPIMWAYDSYGLFGAGLGIGTQGVQHVAEVETAGAAAEGGLGKITLELGIPGLFVVGWLAISVVKHLWRIMRISSRISPRLARLSYALFSFLVANAAAFSVATQAYSDLFILLTLSWTLGFLIAIPALLGREVRAQSPAIVENAPVLRPKTV